MTVITSLRTNGTLYLPDIEQLSYAFGQGNT